MSIYDYSYKSIEGKTVNLSDYKGKVFLIVNTASKCGFTPQYEGLESLYKEYAHKGFGIIGFPCNQFGEQEPENNEGVQNFCKINFGVTFPLSEKINVNGSDALDLYKFLVKENKYEGLGDDKLEKLLKEKFAINFNDNSIKWNFTKFLVDKKGNIKRFEPTVTPEQLKQYIETALKA